MEIKVAQGRLFLCLGLGALKLATIFSLSLPRYFIQKSVSNVCSITI